jgi:hypothetical protein
MGFFDGLTDASFKKGANNENLFFPNGIFGSGYVLKDDAHKNRIQHTMNKGFMVMFSLFIIQAIFVNWIAYPLIAVFVVWHFYWVRMVTKKLPKSSEKLKYSECLYSSAKSTHLIFLILLEIISLGAVFASIQILLRGEEILISLLGIRLFGVGGITFGYEIYLKLWKKNLLL